MPLTTEQIKSALQMTLDDYVYDEDNVSTIELEDIKVRFNQLIDVTLKPEANEVEPDDE